MRQFIDKYGLLLLGVFPFLILMLVRLFGFDGLYGQDAYEYLRYSDELVAFIQTGQSTGYFFWPVYYPLFGVLVNFFTNDIGIALQLVSVFSWSISTIYLHKTIQLLYPENKSSFLFLLLCFLLSPMVVRMGTLVMSDTLATCLILSSSFYALRYFKHQFVKNLYLFSVLGGVAMLTRYASFVVLFPFFLYMGYFLLKEKKDLFHLLGLIILMIAIWFPHFYLKSQAPLEFINHGAITDWSFSSLFKTTLLSKSGVLTYAYPNIVYGFTHLVHPRYLSFGFLLLPIFFIRKLYTRTNRIVISSVLLYSIFLAGVYNQNSRFLLLTFPFVLIILFSAFEFVFQKIISKKVKWLVFIALLVLQIGLATKGMEPIFKRHVLEKSIAAQIKFYQKNILYSFDIDIAMKGRNLDFNHKNLWVEKYSKFEEGALVLFHPTKFQKQFKEENPILNWNNLNENYNLKLLENCSEGWKLYRIEQK